MKLLRLFRKRKHKYFNGINGVISIFLCILLAPFITLAGILVESSRYQSVYEILEQISSSAGLSTLAEYDKYLDERFALQSISQENGDINNTFNEYIKANKSVIGKNAIIGNETTAIGKYSLYNTDILKQQIMDYGETSVLTKFANEIFDFNNGINGFLDRIGINTDLCNKLNGYMDKVNNVTNAANSVKELVTSVIDLKGNLEDIKDKIKKSKDAYNEVQKAIKKLYEKCKKADDIDKITDEDIKVELESLEKKAKDCQKLNKSLLSENSSSGLIPDIIQNIQDIQNNCNNIRQMINEENSENTEIDLNFTNVLNKVQKNICENLLGTIENISNKLFDKFDFNLSYYSIDEFIEIIKNSIKSYIHEDKQWEYDKILWFDFDDYKIIVNDLISEISNFDNIDSDDNGENLFKKISEVFQKLSEINFAYDEDLNANIKQDLFVYQNFGSGQTIADAVTKISNGVNEFNGANWKITEKLEGVIKIFEGIGKFIVGLVQKIGDIISGIAGLSNIKELYNRAIINSYMYYNLPNRLNYKTETGLTGFKYGEIIHNDSEGNDLNFKGAEYEYIITGSNDEITNQTSIFCDILFLRVILNFDSVFVKDPVVRGVSDAVSAIPMVGPALAIAVKVIVLLLESYVDSVLLVNSKKIPIIKKNGCYLGKNITELVNKFMNMTDISKDVKDVIDAVTDYKEEANKNSVESSPSESSNNELELDYGGYTLIGLILTGKSNNILKRFANIVQLESSEYYKAKGSSFNLKNAYSYIYTDVRAELQPFFGGIKLNENGKFDVRVQRYKGY